MIVEAQHASRRRHLGYLIAFAAAAAAYWALRAATVNADGYQYYRMLTGGALRAILMPGHLLYLPLVKAFASPAAALVEQFNLLKFMVLINVLAGAACLVATHATARRLGCSAQRSLFAVTGLALSFGFWIQATDVETYALALLGVCASFYCMARYAAELKLRWLVMLALANAFAVMMHLATASIVTASALMILMAHWGSWRVLLGRLLAYGLCDVAVVVFPVLYIGFFIERFGTLGEIAHWLTSWKDSTPKLLNWLSPARAAYGFVRTFLYLEFFWEAPRWIIALKMTCFAAAAGAAILSMWIFRPHMSSTGSLFWRSMVPFVLLQVAAGVLHYGSDTERWIFIAPLVWICVSFALATRRSAIAACAMLGLLAAVNVSQAFIPAARNDATRVRVAAIQRAVAKSSAILTPGLDWTMYIPLYSDWTPVMITFDDVMKRAKTDQRAFFTELDAKIDQQLRENRPVVMVRILDPGENFATTPWQGLVDWGYSIEGIQAWARHRPWKEQRLDDPAGTRIYLLSP